MRQAPDRRPVFFCLYGGVAAKRLIGKSGRIKSRFFRFLYKIVAGPRTVSYIYNGTSFRQISIK
ncbi:hypothetical protein GS3922_03495 [Geobacillus subterraneus]|uniref:Uncharacterized protein n=1 Tax=Geobacillus subterraneus TaxID=129338 RepID=A0ABM6A9C7_9BACL|nr:hypothetical protein GS3922_03495 [Geobacillus subterraneus]